MIRTKVGLRGGQPIFICRVLAVILFFSCSTAWGGPTFLHQGPVSPVNDLSVGHNGPRVAVDGQGNAYAVWADHRNGNSDIYFSYKPVGGAWGSNVRVNDDTGGFQQTSPCIALDQNGNAFALWVDYRHGNPDIYFAYRPAGGNWGANVRVNDDAGTAFQSSPAVAVDGNGTAYAVWEDERNGHGDIYFSFLPMGSGWQPNVRVNDDTGAGSQNQPSIALDAARNAYAVWRDNRSGGDQIFFAYRPAGGSWQANSRVDDDAGNADKDHPVIAVDPNGNACAAWEDQRNGGLFNRDIYAACRPAAGTWASNLKVNDDSVDADQYGPAIAVTRIAGTYIFWVAWVDFRNGNSDIYGSVFAGSFWTLNAKHPTTADTANQYAPSLAVGPNLHACVVWVDDRDKHNDVYGSCQPPGAAWEENRRINSDPAGSAVQYDPAVALDPQGNTYLVWQDSRNGPSDIYFAARPAGGPWGTAVKINDDGGAAVQSSPALAVDPQGTIYALWTDNRNGDPDIYFSKRPAGGSWEVNVRVNDDIGPAYQFNPSIAVDRQGNAYAIWQDRRFTGAADIFFSRRPSGGSWGANVRVNDNGAPAFHSTPSIAVDHEGNAYAVWQDARNGRQDVYFSYRPAGGTWSANVRVNEDTDFYRQNPVIAVDDSGNAQVIWLESRFPKSFVNSSYRPTGGNWQPEIRVHDWGATVSQSDPCLAVDGSGKAYAVWVEILPHHWELYMASRTSGGPWENATRINRDAGQALKYEPALAVNDAGQAVVVWEDYGYGDRAVFYSFSGAQVFLPLILK